MYKVLSFTKIVLGAQTSYSSRAEANVNDLGSLCELICIKFGSEKIYTFVKSFVTEVKKNIDIILNVL
jgi:hypothetical protein